MDEKNKISWSAPEYVAKKKSVDWFWAVWIVSLSLSVTSVILGNVLLAILILSATFATTLYAIRKPKMARFEIGQRGIKINEKLYPYDSLDSFGIDEAEVPPKLLLKSGRTLMPFIAVPLSGISVDVVREALEEYLGEEDHSESLSVRIMESLGF